MTATTAPQVTPDRTTPSIRPDPDPTAATQQQIDRSLISIRDYIDGRVDQLEIRLDGDERAAGLRLKAIDLVPDRIDEKVSHLKELDEARAHYEREISDFRFQATAALTTSADDLRATALIAAFAAQKESAAVAQTTTTAALASLGTLVQTSIGALNDKVDDLKDRTGKIESTKLGITEQRAAGTENRTAVYATVGLIVTVVLAAITIGGVLLAVKP